MSEQLYCSKQGTHSNFIFKFPVYSLCFPCVFPGRPQIFPVPIYIICDYNNTKLTWETYPASGKKLFLLWQISQCLLLFESEHLSLEQKKFPVFSLCFDKIPCVLTKFPIPCVFPDRDFFWPFSLFSLCRGYRE